MFLDTREHVAEFNNPGPALAISNDELRARVRAVQELPVMRAAWETVRSIARGPGIESIAKTVHRSPSSIRDRDGI